MPEYKRHVTFNNSVQVLFIDDEYESIYEEDIQDYDENVSFYERFKNILGMYFDKLKLMFSFKNGSKKLI